ncbi:succinate dehydrogenase assembly factor 4, mitochondrial [Trichomonascus vanleenenianus]|uniref:Sdh8p n=1 Tax=Trichomonascus vanleenenianus TaxID=2268995 RepID=UPI003ECA967D
MMMFKQMSKPTTALRLLPRSIARGYAAFGAPKGSPSPPPLPKEEQAEFERLQKLANTQAALDMTEEELQEFAKDVDQARIIKEAKLATHPQFRQPYQDFEGEVNPETGEVGGPKQDPLRHGDYSFNGRVTDF